MRLLNMRISNKISKKHIIAFLASLAVMAIVHAIFLLILVNFQEYFRSTKHIPGFEDVNFISFTRALSLLTAYLVPIAGGISIGYVLKKNGLFYGGLLAFVSLIFPLLILLIMLIFRDTFFTSAFPLHESNRFLIVRFYSIIRGAPFGIFLSAIGGLIGEKIINLKKKQEII